jgi:hypothetical protein
MIQAKKKIVSQRPLEELLSHNPLLFNQKEILEILDAQKLPNHPAERQ